MLRTYFQETFYDMPVEIAQKYAEGIRVAILSGKDFEGDKKQGFLLSKNRGFEDKLYIGNIHRIENHLYWNDEELQEDDQIIDVVMLDGPVTRDGDGCSYGSKDHRDQIMYANTIPQVVGHLFVINTPGGAASARIDYEQAIADCREKGKPTVAWVDGMCCSAGQLVAALCDRTIVMNGRHTMGCIGTMCAFWGVANGTVSQDGYRYIELVSVTSPDKNAEYREACDGKTEKLQAELDKLGEEFRETVRQNRPQVKEEHLTGKTFDADEVMGALVDEIGDYSRAVQAVFDLAGETLTAARFMTAEPKEKPEEKPDGEEQEEKTQEAAVAQQHTQQESTPKNNKENMTEQEKKAQEAEAAQAAEQQAEEQAQQEQQTEEGTQQEQQSEEGAQQEQASEEGQQQAQEEAPAGEQSQEEQNQEDQAAEEQQQEQQNEDGVQQEQQNQEQAPASQENNEAAQELAQVQETLHNAETMIAEKDQQIASLKESLATLNGIAEERDAAVKERNDISASLEKAGLDYAEQGKELSDAQAKIAEHVATIETLKKQVADLKAEVKELAGKPAPMTNADSGVPQDNGTGEAPKQKQRITSDMTYEEIRAAKKKAAEEAKKK